MYGSSYLLHVSLVLDGDYYSLCNRNSAGRGVFSDAESSCSNYNACVLELWCHSIADLPSGV